MIYWLQHELNITIIYLIGNFLSNFNVSGSTFVQGTRELHFCGIFIAHEIIECVNLTYTDIQPSEHFSYQILQCCCTVYENISKFRYENSNIIFAKFQ